MPVACVCVLLFHEYLVFVWLSETRSLESFSGILLPCWTGRRLHEPGETKHLLGLREVCLLGELKFLCRHVQVGKVHILFPRHVNACFCWSSSSRAWLSSGAISCGWLKLASQKNLYLVTLVLIFIPLLPSSRCSSENNKNVIAKRKMSMHFSLQSSHPSSWIRI